MGGYQGFYENIPFPMTRTVPTDAQLRGDFSQTTTANGTPILIYDPATTVCNANFSRCTRQPFPSNVIPRESLASDRAGAAAAHPAAERDAEQPRRLEQLHQLAEHRPLSLQRLSHAHRSHLQPQATGCRSATAATGASSSATRTRCRSRRSAATTIRRTAITTCVTVDDNYTINASTLWNTRVSWDRFDEPHDKIYGDVNPKLPFAGPYQLTGPPFPQIDFGAYEDMFPRTFRQPKNDAFSVNSNLSKSMGRHFLKAGGEYRAYQFFRFDEVATNGVFEFINDFTRRDPLTNTGADVGQRLRDVPPGPADLGRVTTGTPRTEQYRYYAIYLQDDWKIGSRLTVNLGVRWDYQPAVTVKDNLTVSGFDFDATNPLQSQLPQGAATINPATGQPLALRGGLLFANRGGPEVALQE